MLLCFTPNLNFIDYLKIKYKTIVEKVDLWRLLKIYNEGGIYVDFDRYCNKSFKDIIKSDTKCILPTFRDIDFSHDIMISCKNNPIYKRAIEYNLKKRSILPGNNIFFLGPVVYMWAITETVFGEKKDRNIDAKTMIQYRNLLEKSDYFHILAEQRILPYPSPKNIKLRSCS